MDVVCSWKLLQFAVCSLQCAVCSFAVLQFCNLQAAEQEAALGQTKRKKKWKDFFPFVMCTGRNTYRMSVVRLSHVRRGLWHCFQHPSSLKIGRKWLGYALIPSTTTNTTPFLSVVGAIARLWYLTTTRPRPPAQITNLFFLQQYNNQASLCLPSHKPANNLPQLNPKAIGKDGYNLKHLLYGECEFRGVRAGPHCRSLTSE